MDSPRHRQRGQWGELGLKPCQSSYSAGSHYISTWSSAISWAYGPLSNQTVRFSRARPLQHLEKAGYWKQNWLHPHTRHPSVAPVLWPGSQNYLNIHDCLACSTFLWSGKDTGKHIGCWPGVPTWVKNNHCYGVTMYKATQKSLICSWCLNYSIIRGHCRAK